MKGANAVGGERKKGAAGVGEERVARSARELRLKEVTVNTAPGA
jgi:hypothetical protein